MPIRNSAKALILRDGKLLCTKNVGWRGDDYYLLPGGGQQDGETLVQALERECFEELGAKIKVGELRYVREYIGKNHAFAERHADLHQVEHMFVCELLSEPRHVHSEDSVQTDVVWVKLERLASIQFFPSVLAKLITPNGLTGPVYLGDTN